ncbi:MAG: LysM peptidoglycan-binding domain-containing protein [Anaerolineaceae bacterium]|nr:LysM peptidoglycan-binding domain-containing protein [Anaerolineaceae bacterium]
MLGIAFLYKITLEELMAANPDIKPNLMSVGTVLIIPGARQEEENVETETTQIQPTAIPVETGQVFCVSTREGGAWCSLPVRNTQEFALEGLSAVIHLVDSKSLETLSQTAFLPLDLLQPGQSLPFTAYFPPPVPAAFQANIEIVSALPNSEDGRYLPTRIDHQQVFLTEDGLSAEVKLDVFLERPDITAKRVWVAVIAYDQQGNVIGLRRWEKPGEPPLNPGEMLPVSLMIYSTTGPIHRVELAVEARP